MDSARWERMKEVFHLVADLPGSQQQERLQSACGDDPAMMDDVFAMLREDAVRGSILDGNLPDAVGNRFGKTSLAPTEYDLGPYRILRLLGEGGMGVVYLASREDLGNQVALKFLRDGFLSPERRERFADEQKTLARLEHPGIARIYDANTLKDGTPWFAMEYVEGQSITKYCDELGCSLEKRIRLFRSICEAVQYAHRQTIIHRDLKPTNILVKADGTVKLLDFGIAKQLADPAMDVDARETTLHPMTLPYASPEQVRGDPLGTQTDVYSLGVILYELLCGQLPFDFSHRGRTDAERMILERTPEPPSTVAKKADTASRTHVPELSRAVWRDLDALCLTAMHKDLGRRYPSVEALIRDIDHYLTSEPLEARPDSLRYRSSKFIARNFSILSATVAVCTLIVILVVFFVARLSRARNAALAEANRTQRIEMFMLNLFDGGDKSAGPSEGLKVVTLLDGGVENARTLNGDPAVQADLYQTLGHIYQLLGKFDQADPLLRSAIEERKAVDGADSPEVAESIVGLGLLRLDQGKAPDAERMVREGLAMSERHLPAGDPAIARARTALGRVLEDRGAYGDAIKVLDDSVRLQAGQRQPTTDLSTTLHALADAHYYLGELSTADSLDRQAMAMDTQLYGEVHPRVADDLFDLGEIQHDLGRDADAEKDYRQSLAINQTWYGIEHPRTALSMAAVGQSLVYQSRYDDAAPVLQQALAIQERTLGKAHPQVAMGLNTLGLLEIRRRRFKDAEADFNRMAEINRSVYGDRHYLVGIALLNLGQVYLEEKQYPRAETEYREALTRFTEKLPAGHTSTAITQIQLGHVLVMERRFKEAEGHLLAGYEVLSKQPGPQGARIERARADLVSVYEALNRPDQASVFRAPLPAASAAGAAKH